MARTPKDVTDAELAVLEVLWRHGAMRVREIADLLYPGGSHSESATVQKLCERLLCKRYVTRDRQVRPATFAAGINRDDLIGRHLKGVADKLCSGSFAPLLTHLVESADLDAADLQKLRDQVARLDRQEPDSTRPDAPGEGDGR
jgi:BlaI family transcriptional regulator, penicillinase repressor